MSSEDEPEDPAELNLTASLKKVSLSGMKTAVEIYKFLPKTNCGKCGTTSCFGFAAKLATHQASPADCPNLTSAAREALQGAAVEKHTSPGTVYDQALESLQPKIKTLDFGRIAPFFGVTRIGPDTLKLRFLNEDYEITKKNILDPSGKEPRPWISILIYNHLCMPDPPTPAGEWTSFSSIPASHAKDKAWAGHVEDVIAKHFSGNVDGLKEACEKIGGKSSDVKGDHDAAYEFRFFPHYPVLLLFYDAMLEEPFPAQCRLLLDKTAPRYLDIESIVVLGEEFAARLTEQ
jgi:hypothetical protein